MTREITVVPTLRCNLNCSYCIQKQAIDNHPARQTSGHFNEKSAVMWYDFFRKISQPTKLVFSGGEPFLYKGFQELLLSVTNKNICRPVIVITNLAASVKTMKKLLEREIQFIISLHNSLNRKETDIFLDKLRKINHTSISIRILTDFSDEERLVHLMKFMHQYRIQYQLGLIYKIDHGRFEKVNNINLESLLIKDISGYPEEELKIVLRKKLSRLIPFWVKVLLIQSGGLGSVDIEAVKNFILFPDYYCTENTKLIRCGIPLKHLTVYPDGSIWVCNIFLKNAFHADFKDDFKEIECPDFGHCIETCTAPPFTGELVHT